MWMEIWIKSPKTTKTILLATNARVCLKTSFKTKSILRRTSCNRDLKVNKFPLNYCSKSSKKKTLIPKALVKPLISIKTQPKMSNPNPNTNSSSLLLQPNFDFLSNLNNSNSSINLHPHSMEIPLHSTLMLKTLVPFKKIFNNNFNCPNNQINPPNLTNNLSNCNKNWASINRKHNFLFSLNPPHPFKRIKSLCFKIIISSNKWTSRLTNNNSFWIIKNLRKSLQKNKAKKDLSKRLNNKKKITSNNFFHFSMS